MSNEVDENELVRKTIRIMPLTDKRLVVLMGTGKFVTESELIRKALEIGLDALEKKHN